MKVYKNIQACFLLGIVGACSQHPPLLFETILNYQMMVERYPNLKEEVGVSIPGCEISSLPAGKLA
jgi:hypothetical protein